MSSLSTKLILPLTFPPCARNASEVKGCRAEDAAALCFLISTNRVKPSFLEFRTACDFKANSFRFALCI
ncbi:mCG147199 [Mus musculus]|jgi:hypothetical protein|nr:mCG147199 [Mus musculus]